MYADIIIDISHEAVDKVFQYKIPDELLSQAQVGKTVVVPFGRGNKKREGYIVGISNQVQFDPSKVKEIISIRDTELKAEKRLIELALWMKEEYGSTMIQALKTVLSVRQKTGALEEKTIYLLLPFEEAKEKAEKYKRKHFAAKERVLQRLMRENPVSYRVLCKEENITGKTVESLEKEGVLRMESSRRFKNPVKNTDDRRGIHPLNDQQQLIYEEFVRDDQAGIRKTYLLYGVTGSGKTEVYLSLIRRVIETGRQVIVLIPEISLTHQTVSRFYTHFGDQVSFVNSRLSKGEKYDQFVRAQKGEISIMIGPRSALFTPFSNLGLIIIDEEHEGAYKSETSPKYHARDAAAKLASLCGASLVLGSATPSLESFTKAKLGIYRLWILKQRANQMALPTVSIIDLREELKAGNRSMFSRQLREAIEDRLNRKEQVMLFLNRRGFAGFISCRACGFVLKCPHCDVSLTYHRGGRMVCHYCGYERAIPKLCPECKSKHIAAFGTGTQKVEAALYREFPEARVLRMDMDTTRKKDSYDQMLSAFSKGEADILVGTQMIVKGHDFSRVTLMGIIAADLSLHAGDFRAGEKTFQLLTQAAGRAGRGNRPGEVMIQTYQPDHYAIVTAGRQNYEEFYEQEMTFRRLLKYPPACEMLVVFCTSRKEEDGIVAMNMIASYLHRIYGPDKLMLIGPGEGAFPKINDVYRRVLYIKENNADRLLAVRNRIEDYTQTEDIFSQVHLYYDRNPMGIY
ncbi:MAG: primosomal protein N' [Lachnospiraceae bacterium]|nr:primosomal protein N' [Lachnospiraceae bacterium]